MPLGCSWGFQEPETFKKGLNEAIIPELLTAI